MDTSLENGRSRLNEASQAMDGFISLLAARKESAKLDSEQMFALLWPIQDNLHQALDELQYAGGGDEKSPARS